jgi:2-dehydro-3-deoxyphosphooctonate aldolase (KDO 8-P synthase)
MKTVTVGNIEISNANRFALLAGPCQLESLDHARMLAEKIGEACAANGVPYVFKASYDKANRTSLSGKRGLGIDKGLEILHTIREEFGCPVVTDVHDIPQVQRCRYSANPCLFVPPDRSVAGRW